jgi:hypothetical protein
MMAHLQRRRTVLALAATMAALAGLTAGHTLASPRPAAPAQATVPPGDIVVQGRVLYIDRASDRNHPAAGVKVEIWDKDYNAFSTGDKLDETVTDASGFYVSKAIPNVDVDGPAGQKDGTQDVYIKLFTDNGNVRVLHTGTTQEFDWNSYEIDAKDGLLRNVPDGVVGMPQLIVAENTKDIEALWTFVDLVEGWSYLKNQTGRDPGPVLAYWSKTSNDGPRYDPEAKAIFLRDADAGFGSVVVQQEAYALLHNLYGTLPGGWDKCTTGPAEGMTSVTAAACAFVQGLATAFPLAVHGDPVFESLTLNSTNMDTQSATSPGWASGDTVPGRVAGAFWDLLERDQTEETYDQFNATFLSVWNAVSARKPATMREWWDAWRTANDACGALGSLFQNTIDYNTPPQVAALGPVVMDEDTTKVLKLDDFVNDVECGDAAIKYTLVSAGDSHAGVRLMPTRTISITPEANWFGQTQFTVRVSDGPANIVQNVSLTVRPVNDCPIIAPPIQDSEVTYSSPVVYNLMGSATDVEDQPFNLKWRADLENPDPDVTIDGQGTSSLTFRLNPTVITRHSVRALFGVTDRDGCTTRQPVAITWTDRPNRPPWIKDFLRDYKQRQGEAINVDLTGVAGDDEDGPVPLQWYVIGGNKNAVLSYPEPKNHQILQFSPDPSDFVGSNVIDLQVKDTQGASATTAITITWVPTPLWNNYPPEIIRPRLKGRTVGKNGLACYDLSDKATDPNDPVSSLVWYASDYDRDTMEVPPEYQGTQKLCVRPRPEFIGCATARFVVRDPHTAEDSEEVRTCWEDIRIFLPFATQNVKHSTAVTRR